MNELQPINFTRGVPAAEAFPIAQLSVCAKTAVETSGQTLLQYGQSSGYQPLRNWLADRYGVSEDQVLIANGSLQIIEFLCYQLLEPGDLIFTEAPSYDRAITLFRRRGAKIVGIPLEDDGPNLEVLRAALARQTPKLFYVIPDFQNPSGATCSLEKRHQLVGLAAQHGFWLLEDAPYRALRYRGQELPSLFELAPGQVLHLLSFSKLVGPGARVGFVVGETDLLAKVGKVAEDTYITPALLGQGTIFEFCRLGYLTPHIEKLRRLYAPRLDSTLQALERHLPQAKATRPDGGFFLSITLPEGILTTELKAQAATKNLNLADGQAFFPDGGGERFLRLPYCALSPEQIDEGIRRLAVVVSEM
jgi:2-aminoadipate transaminase